MLEGAAAPCTFEILLCCNAERVQKRINIQSMVLISVMNDHASFRNGMYSEG